MPRRAQQLPVLLQRRSDDGEILVQCRRHPRGRVQPRRPPLAPSDTPARRRGRSTPPPSWPCTSTAAPSPGGPDAPSCHDPSPSPAADRSAPARPEHSAASSARIRLASTRSAIFSWSVAVEGGGRPQGEERGEIDAVIHVVPEEVPTAEIADRLSQVILSVPFLVQMLWIDPSRPTVSGSFESSGDRGFRISSASWSAATAVGCRAL